MKISFFRRLKICLSWQWRWKVVVNDIKSTGEAMMDLILQTAGSILGVLILPLWPIILLWRYTGGVLWHAKTLSDTSILELGKYSPDKRNESLSTAIGGLGQ